MPIITKIAPPALPSATEVYSPAAQGDYTSVLRLFFNRLVNVVNILVGNIPTTVKTVSTTTYTLTADDHNSIILFDHASGCTVTGPVASSEDLFDANDAFICHLHQEVAAQVTFVAEVGATSRTAIGLKTRTQYSSISIITIATSTYKVIGDSVV